MSVVRWLTDRWLAFRDWCDSLDIDWPDDDDKFEVEVDVTAVTPEPVADGGPEVLNTTVIIVADRVYEVPGSPSQSQMLASQIV